ncbi:DUF6684 family protein [Halobacterium litoreum]|uniref:DUF6684 family protein n=1 Tax=Halobacterium litoreum TaxID=2039234 RepID=A0ABD5NII9_9EURY|nr:DUF6684 family protein [Halobacterium litoreum]UHH12357.1 hypothetical protein LT972_09325 [Halobacterium litoreum]
MSSRIFTKDTLLDISVNVIPLVIMAFFIVVFVALNPWAGGFTLERVLQFVLVAWILIGLAVLTYVAATRIETGEEVEPWHAGIEEHEAAEETDDADAETTDADDADDES